MRALRVIGLEDDGKTVLLEDPDRGERFVLPADERLRAAARGDLTRLGQIEVESESQMRPREIQARIRAGESVEQVALAAGIPKHRVERFAYPVLLERSRTAELAQRAHPVREDGPDVQTLGEVVAHSFGLRGQDYGDVSWDAWRGEDGRWVVQLHWTAGRSDNRAHWAFHPGVQGGTVTALDEAAVDLMDPNPNRGLRSLRPVTQLARAALELEKPAVPVEPEILVREEPAPVLPPPVVEPEPEPVPAAPVAEEPAPVPPQPGARKEPPKRGKKNHPIVPSWEDVLLGVRSNRG
ncbi:septation protein SepH [Actinosynnema sp. NPDC059797]